MNNYPSDEELIQFIENLEKQELYAPRNMKREILAKAFPKQAEEELPETKSEREKPVPTGRLVLFTYRLKIIAGMAAAIAALLILPAQGGIRTYRTQIIERNSKAESLQTEEKEASVDVKNVLNDSTRKVNQKMNAWIEYLNQVFDSNNGGNVNEN